MRVLFLGSSPASETRLRLDREYREIDSHLRENREGAEIELVGSWAVRVPDLSRELLRHRPDVVHFSGHGSPTGLIFDTDGAEGQVTPIEPLADLFGLASRAHPMTMVVLNACYTRAQAEVIARRIPIVVGTTSTITDDGAIAFASGLYRGLAFDLAPPEAIELGRAEVSLRGLPDAGIILTSHQSQDPQ
jgi:hypothetical protein